MEHCLWHTGRTGCEHHRQFMIRLDLDGGLGGVFEGGGRPKVEGAIQRFSPDGHPGLDARKVAPALRDERIEFGPEYEKAGMAHLGSERDVGGGEAKVQRHDHRAQLDDRVVTDQPFERVVLQVQNVISPPDPEAAGQIIRDAVDLLVELFPGQGASLGPRRCTLNQADLSGQMPRVDDGISRVVHSGCIRARSGGRIAVECALSKKWKPTGGYNRFRTRVGWCLPASEGYG